MRRERRWTAHRPRRSARQRHEGTRNLPGGVGERGGELLGRMQAERERLQDAVPGLQSPRETRHHLLFSPHPQRRRGGLSPRCGAATGRHPGPPDSLIPSGPLGAAIQRGRALLMATRDSLPRHVGNALRCASCHLDEGRRATGSLVGVYGRYPAYRPRSGIVETIEYRVNDCFKRSLNGGTLDPAGEDMRDIVAYLAFLSWGSAPAPP